MLSPPYFSGPALSPFPVEQENRVAASLSLLPHETGGGGAICLTRHCHLAHSPVLRHRVGAQQEWVSE